MTDHVLTSSHSASLTFWQTSLFHISGYYRPTLSNYKRNILKLVSCRVFIVKMCGSLTLIPQKGNLFVFQVDIFLWKTGWIWMHCCGAPPRYCATTNRSVETMHNKAAQLRFKALLAVPFFLLFVSSHPTVPIHPILFYYEIPYFCEKCSVVCFKYTCLFLFTPCLGYAHKGLR